MQCCFVYTVTGEAASVMNEFAFSFRPTRKDQQVGGGDMLMFHVDVNMKLLATLSFERH